MMQVITSDYPAVGAYCETDFSARSEIGGQLVEQASEEAQHVAIQLSNLTRGDCWASNLTAAMSTWLEGEVVPFRRQAIEEIAAGAAAISIGKSEGIWLEHELETVDRQLSIREAELEGEFTLANQELVANHEELEARYDQIKRDEGGRDAKVANRKLEWGVLFPLILIPESLLNFDSFRRAPIIASDAMALGITIIVGLGIAVAAHLLGTFFKQLDFWMRADDKVQQGKGLRMASIGAVLLLASLASVGAARYYYLIPMRAEAVILGQTPPNIVMQIAASLIGNVVVFMLGGAFAYMLHDTNPAFAETKEKLDDVNARYAKAREKTLNRKIAEAKAAAKAARDKAEGIDKQMQSKPGYSTMRAQVAKLGSQDAKVGALLSTYRSRLVSLVSKRDQEFAFTRLPVNKRFEGEVVPLDRFLAEPIRLYRGKLK